jgi:uncharacterized protein (DUF1800 family)
MELHTHADSGFQDNPTALNERERAAHLLSRLSYGPRPGEADKVMAMGTKAWLKDQLQPQDSHDPRLKEWLSEYETLDMSVRECAEFTFTARERGKEPSAEERKAERQKRRIPLDEVVWSTALRAVYSDRQATEVMSEFWRNHLNVSFTKGQSIFSMVPDYERTVIRNNVWGSFPDMLRASAMHPAMLTYLDNHLSRRPPSKQELKEIERRTKRKTGSKERAVEAVQIATQRGLNENYARELLELHTLGVDNFYKQKDVIALAKILTGWTIDGGRKGTQEFTFKASMHVKGDIKLLGKRYQEDKEGGPGQGMKVLEMLGGHKGTADFIAMKMVRFLVADHPPEKLVTAVAKTYRKTKGNLVAMVETIVDSEEFWARENYRTKFKTPYEFIMSALRVTGAEIGRQASIGRYLADMGQPIYHCDDPTGYYDTADAWLDPGVMALRWQFATDLALGKVRGVRIPETFFDQIPFDGPPRLWQHHLTTLILPGGAGARTRAALATVTSEYLEKKKKRVPDLYEIGPTLVGLLLGSPEFQQQ